MVEDKGNRILLDFRVQIGKLGDFYAEFHKESLSYTIIRIRFKELHKFYASPEPKDNTERKAGDQNVRFHYIPELWTPLKSYNNPFSEIKYFYEVNGFVFKI